MIDDASRSDDADGQERLERLYAACLDLDDVERQAFLEANCPDKELRAEIESLLASAAEAGPFMDLLGRGWQPEADDDLVDRLDAALSGRYRIEAEIGRGGMATVYRVHDLRHDRRAALKLLRPELAALIGTERFLREIRTTANLQHPHILPLFDSGAADGFLYYVMPFIEGDSLREILRRDRQLPVDAAVRITTRIASALAYAHQAGIIHRDIKPENILVSSGEPLVADFGIAVAANALTDQRLTETGFSPGTPHYMSPEQATGEPYIGPPSDVYALGCVLHEMLVGEPPHSGSTPQAILARVIASEPVFVSTARKSVPPNVDAAVRKALAKLPADRFAGAREFADALADPGFRYGEPMPADVGYRGRLNAGLAAACVILAGFAVWGWLGRTTAPPPALVTSTSINLDGDHRIEVADFDAFPIALSPDGRTLAYVGESTDGTRLYVRALDSYDLRPLDDTDDARQPFFSLDGDWIAYFARGSLYRVPVQGGPPDLITRLPLQESSIPHYPTGGAWGPDDLIVFVAGNQLWRVGLNGEPPELVRTTVDAEESGDPDAGGGGVAPPPGRIRGWPSFLPAAQGDDDPTVLVVIDGELAAVSIRTGDTRSLGLSMNGHARFVPPDHLLFTMTTGVLRAVRFDVDSREIRGTPVSVLDNVFRANLTSATFLAVSANGTIAYVPGGSQRILVRVDRAGRATELPLEPSLYRFPSVSPDGNMIVVSGGGGAGLLLVDPVSGAVGRLVGGLNGVWSPDGQEIAFSLGGQPLRIRAVPGARPEGLFSGAMPPYPEGWRTDGRIVLYDAPHGEGDIYVATIGASVPDTVTATANDEREPARSGDGRYLAYISDVSGRPEVYVRGLDSDAEPVRVSVNGGANPLWSRTANELFFWKGEQLLSSRIEQEQPLRMSAPTTLFTGRYLQGGPNWDAFPNGDFVVVSAGPNWLREIRVIENFVADLDRRQVGGSAR